MCIRRIAEKSTIRVDVPPTVDRGHRARICTGGESPIPSISPGPYKEEPRHINPCGSPQTSLPTLQVCRDQRPRLHHLSRYSPLHFHRMHLPPHHITLRSNLNLPRQPYLHHAEDCIAANLASLSRSDTTLIALTSDMPKLRLRKVMRSKEMVSWLNIIPTVVNGMSPSKMKFRDGIRMRYRI